LQFVTFVTLAILFKTSISTSSHMAYIYGYVNHRTMVDGVRYGPAKKSVVELQCIENIQTTHLTCWFVTIPKIG